MSVHRGMTRMTQRGHPTAWTCAEKLLTLGLSIGGRIGNTATRVHHATGERGGGMAACGGCAARRPDAGDRAADAGESAGLGNECHPNGPRRGRPCRRPQLHHDGALCGGSIRPVACARGGSGEEPGQRHSGDRVAGPGANRKGSDDQDSDRLCLWRRSDRRWPCRQPQPARRKCNRRDLHRQRAARKTHGGAAGNRTERN
jgi:hypothetical protein